MTKLLQILTPERFFLLSVIGVNGLNFIYNLILGRMLGPEEFADAALMVTILLIFSFLASTFQIVTTKFEASLEDSEKQGFYAYLTRKSLSLGVVLMLFFILFSSYLQQQLHTQNAHIFKLFGIGIPIYFLLSINRGYYQGKLQFYQLSFTYIFEVLVKLGISVSFIYYSVFQSSISVAIAIVLSLLLACFPFGLKKEMFAKAEILPSLQKTILVFSGTTLLYELVQVLINSSDIFLVKMFFDNEEAGLYASLALIGRVVYFMAWMFVMLLLPKVVTLQKEGKETQGILFQYFGLILIIAVGLVVSCYFFSEEIVQLMFGAEFLSIHTLLWKYALSTSLFALSNLLVYYAISISKFFPVYIALFFGILQIVLIYLFHATLNQVVEMQIIAMFSCLASLLIYFGIRFPK